MRATRAPPLETERCNVLQVVCIKQVPDTETRVKLAADGRSLDPTGVTMILNPYDEFAVEQALRVKEQLGTGEVVVVSVGSAAVQTTLRNALAMGADRALLLTSSVGSPDALAVAKALAEAIRPLEPGIVWLGKQAVDDDGAQVGPMLATLLGRRTDGPNIRIERHERAAENHGQRCKQRRTLTHLRPCPAAPVSLV